MKILVDITHPAHVHFFKHAIREWEARGHEVIIASRDKDLTVSLLDRYGFSHATLSRARSGIAGLGFEMLQRGYRLWGVVRKEQPAVLVGVGGTFIAPVGKLTRTPVVVFTDTEHARISNAITFPLASVVCTPACYEDKLGEKQVVYDGYQELAYLHPNRFTPDPSQLEPFGVSPEEPYIVMRVVAWTAGHDIGDRGFSDLRSAVETLCHHGRVLISSESALPRDLAEYNLSVSPEHIHHLLAFSRLYIGESATTASESAILGVPSILVSTSTRGYIKEQERKYGLVYTFSDPETGQQQGVETAVGLLQRPDLHGEWQAKRARMMTEVIDVTAFVIHVVEQYA